MQLPAGSQGTSFKRVLAVKGVSTGFILVFLLLFLFAQGTGCIPQRQQLCTLQGHWLIFKSNKTQSEDWYYTDLWVDLDMIKVTPVEIQMLYGRSVFVVLVKERKMSISRCLKKDRATLDLCPVNAGIVRNKCCFVCSP